jgi:flagellar biosynthesis component FlhA
MAESSTTPPAADVLIEAGPALQSLTDPARPDSHKLCWQIDTNLRVLLAELGIPGPLRVNVTSNPNVQTLRIFVFGVEQRFSLELVQRIYGYFATNGLSEAPLSSAWVGAVLESIPEPNVPAFFASLIVEAVKEHPECLLGPDQAQAYVELVGKADASNIGDQWLISILKKLLNLKLSIQEVPAVLGSIKTGIDDREAEEFIGETVVSRLVPRRIEIEINPLYRKHIADTISPGDAAGFAGRIAQQMRMIADGLFYELGIRLPNIEIKDSNTMRAQAFTIKINHLTSFPIAALKPDELLVNDTVDRLKLIGVVGRPATNPANGNVASIVNISDKTKVTDMGLPTWDAFEYILLSASRQLRTNAWRLIDLETVEHELGVLHGAFPDLILATLANISLQGLTQILRLLLREEVSMRDLKLLLERILAYDYAVVDASKLIVFDDRLPLSSEPNQHEQDDPRYYAQFVRIGLKQYLTHKLTRGQNNLVVYLLDPDIERQLSDHLAAGRGTNGKSGLSKGQQEVILTAVRTEVENLPPTSTVPVILTNSEIRALMREMIEPEFPNLAVVAYDELRTDANIQPIARISLR